MTSRQSKGLYLFKFQLSGQVTFAVGRLGTFAFAPGCYIYTGSAMGGGGLDSRLLRHYHGPASGKRHWHIDYLAPLAGHKEFRVLAAGGLSECELNCAVGSQAGVRVPADGFGSSDCACRSHLHWLPRKVWPVVEGLLPWGPEESKEEIR